MFILHVNSNGETTIKHLNLDLFYEGYPVFVVQIYPNSKCDIPELIFEILEKFFSFQLPLNSSFKIDIKNRRF